MTCCNEHRKVQNNHYAPLVSASRGRLSRCRSRDRPSPSSRPRSRLRLPSARSRSRLLPRARSLPRSLSLSRSRWLPFASPSRRSPCLLSLPLRPRSCFWADLSASAASCCLGRASLLLSRSFTASAAALASLREPWLSRSGRASAEPSLPLCARCREWLLQRAKLGPHASDMSSVQHRRPLDHSRRDQPMTMTKTCQQNLDGLHLCLSDPLLCALRSRSCERARSLPES